VFNNQAEEAVQFYCSLFKVGKIITKTLCGENEPSGPAGSVRSILFQLHDQKYLAVNGGSDFQFTDGMSLMVHCDTQEEIDYFWERLSQGGKHVACGWLVDKFGVRWQVVPRMLNDMLADPDSRKSNKVMQEVLHMKKLEIGKLKEAYNEVYH
jgi:predicted 3-demethylubiquinone-9 3-methyltransferase (glyoxalase superfamily)